MFKLIIFVIIGFVFSSCSSQELSQISEMNVSSTRPIQNNGLSIIVGVVTGSDTSAMVGANVQLIDTKSGTIKKKATVDYDNAFKISGVPFGQYILEISMIGYAKLEGKYIEVTQNTIFLVDVVLKPEANEGCEFPTIVAP